MNALMNNDVQVMSSESLWELINEQRVNASEPEAKYADFIIRVCDELDIDDILNGENFSVKKLSNNTERKIIDLNLEECTLVGMRESKAVRRSVLAKLKELDTKPKLSPMEVLAQTAMAMVEIERQQAITDDRLKAIEAKQSTIEDSNGEFSVKAYFVYADLGSVVNKEANRLGRVTAKYCRANGFPIGKVSDPVFGLVNSYPTHALIHCLTAEGYIPE